MSQKDLFAGCRAADLKRLEALGWVKKQVYGQWYWEHPQSKAWLSEDEALARLRRGEAGPFPEAKDGGQ